MSRSARVHLACLRWARLGGSCAESTTWGTSCGIALCQRASSTPPSRPSPSACRSWSPRSARRCSTAPSGMPSCRKRAHRDPLRTLAVPIGPRAGEDHPQQQHARTHRIHGGRHRRQLPAARLPEATHRSPCAGGSEDIARLAPGELRGAVPKRRPEFVDVVDCRAGAGGLRLLEPVQTSAFDSKSNDRGSALFGGLGVPQTRGRTGVP